MHNHLLAGVPAPRCLAAAGVLASITFSPVLAGEFPAAPAAHANAVRIKVVPEVPQGYPGHPAKLALPLRQDVAEIELRARADGTFDLLEANGAAIATGVDLRAWMPRVPDIARTHPTLTRIALMQREFNRNEAQLPGCDGNSEVRLANNCLRQGLWELILMRTVDGTSVIDSQGWFEFPPELYAELFQRANGLAFDEHQELVAAYQDMGGFDVPLKALRSVQSEKEVAVHALEGSPVVALTEQKSKAHLVLGGSPATYAGFHDRKRQPIQTAKFSEPGYYNSEDPMSFDLAWLAEPEGATVRSVTCKGRAVTLTELEIEFDDGHRLLIADEALAALAPRATPPEKEADVLRLTFGIATPEIRASVADRLIELQAPRANWLMLLDDDGEHVDNHRAGMDRVYLWREDAQTDRLHVLVVGYERIAIVAQYALDWPF
jgi:hypothetical protein